MIYRYGVYHVELGDNTNIMQLNNERIQLTNTIINSLQSGLYGDNQKKEHIPTKTNNTKLVPWGTDGRLSLSGDFRSLIVE